MYRDDQWPGLPMARRCLANQLALMKGKEGEFKLTLEPRAGPTGGAGLALPAFSASLIIPTTAANSFL